MKSNIKTLGIGLVVLVGGIFLLADSGDGPARKDSHDRKRVRVAEVEAAAALREMQFSGITRAARRARLGLPIGGRLVSRPVEVGDPVRKGQVVARLDDRELINAVASARGTYEELEARRIQTDRDLERVKGLQAAKAATPEELEQTESSAEALRSSVRAAAARLQESERLLAETRLIAPFDGVITEVLYEPGEMVVAGLPIVGVSGSGSMEVEVEIPESVLPEVAKGEKASVFLPALGRTVEGEIQSLGLAAAGPGRLFPVIVALPNEESVAPGMTAELTLRLAASASLAVPVEAVINPGGQRPAVFLVRPEGGVERAYRLPVEVGSLLDHRVLVQGDLAVGDRVVVGGQRGLLDGEPVEVER